MRIFPLLHSFLRPVKHLIVLTKTDQLLRIKRGKSNKRTKTKQNNPPLLYIQRLGGGWPITWLQALDLKQLSKKHPCSVPALPIASSVTSDTPRIPLSLIPLSWEWVVTPACFPHWMNMEMEIRMHLQALSELQNVSL